MAFTASQFKAYRERLKEAGICVSCLRSPVHPKGRVTCAECRRRSNDARKVRRRIRGPKCCECSNPTVPGQARCAKHQDYRAKLADGTRARRRADGLCVRCGRPNPDAGFMALCHYCGDPVRRLFKKIQSGG